MPVRTLLILLLAVPAAGLDLPFKHLQVGYGIEVVEGMRGLTDEFPYLAFRAPGETGSRQLVPANTGALLRTRLKASGKMTDPILSKRAALAATRLFVAGVIVKDEKKADELIKTARTLSKELKHLPIRVHEFRPKRWEPHVKRTDEGWIVTLVAFEMDRVLQLVQITANVPRNGRLEIRRKPIVTGPMTIWQSVLIADEDEDVQLARLKAMDEEALRARRCYAKSLLPPRSLDTAWAIARLRLTPRQIDDVWPGPKVVPAAEREYSMVELVGGSWFVYRSFEPDHKVQRFRVTKKPRNGRNVGEVVSVFGTR